MFTVAYVILPMSDRSPADAIRESLAPFENGTRGELPDAMLSFHDMTDRVRLMHEATLTFEIMEKGGTRIDGGGTWSWSLDTRRIVAEMREAGETRRRTRFADGMTLDEFAERYVRDLERDPSTGRYGRMLNPIGEWDWWDLGGRFDGRIIGERPGRGTRPVASVSSGPSAGRTIVGNVGRVLGEALGQEAPDEVDVMNDRNVEMTATLLSEAEAGREHAFPGSIVLPPGSADDALRWLRTWPTVGPAEGFAFLGLPEPEPHSQDDWQAAVKAAYDRFPDHWAAGVAYHF